MSIAKGLAWAFTAVTLLGTGGYVFRYLYLWEWHRALIAGLLFVAAEVAFATALVLRGQRRRAAAPAGDPAVRARIAEAAGPTRDHFAWLRESVEHPNVFITVLLGGGIVASGLAWLVERVARGTGDGQLADDLAARLERVAFPAALVPDDDELLAQDDDADRDDPDLRLLLGPGASTAPSPRSAATAAGPGASTAPSPRSAATAAGPGASTAPSPRSAATAAPSR